MPKGYVNNKPPIPPDRTGAKKENPKLLMGPFRFAPDVAAILKKQGNGKATSFAEDAIREKDSRETKPKKVATPKPFPTTCPCGETAPAVLNEQTGWNECPRCGWN